LNRAVRASNQAARARVRAQAAQIREQERRHQLMEKVAKQVFVEGRIAQIEEENRHLESTIGALQSILKKGLQGTPKINFAKLHQQPIESTLNTDPLLVLPNKPVETAFLPPPMGWFSKFVPGAVDGYNASVARAKSAYSDAWESYQAVIRRREAAFAVLQAEADKTNSELDKFRAALLAAEPDAVVAYYKMVYEQAEYPEGFPQEYQLAFSPESKQLVVDVQFPTLADVVPTIERFKYVKSTNQINETKKPEKVRQAVYAEAISQATLRCLHDAFKADPAEVIHVAVLNAYLSTVDPSTGREIKPYIISVRISRDEFSTLDLHNVEPIACLKRLHASVSRSPAELVAIKPLVDINMCDPRFIQEQDVLSTLDTRPNLMELTPSQFESLITNLFQKMGLETKLTQASRDGGVDCVAYDSRPVLGGKVIVQAKRYKNTVGVSAVRDLFGTVHNEGACKGILVTTSGYGRAAYDFANGKPLELITGGNLLYMLKEHSGIDAKIVMPDDWIDPAPAV
jgi:restriction system protein